MSNRAVKKRPTKQQPPATDLAAAPRGPARSPVAERAREYAAAARHLDAAASNFIYEPLAYRWQQMAAAASDAKQADEALCEAIAAETTGDVDEKSYIRAAIVAAAAGGV